MIDTHAHVHSKAFSKDRDEVLKRTWDSGGRFLVEVNIHAAGWPLVRKLASLDPRIFITAGIHPHDTGRATPEELDEIFASLEEPKVCAIGETGLDFYRDYAPRDMQEKFFRRHVAVARDTGMPLVVHSRAAHEETLKILKQEGRGLVRGVFHCFSGDEDVAESVLALGFFIGLGGAVTYNPRRAGRLVRAIGLDDIVLETDCPYMTPHPRRNDRNEPANIPKIAEAIAGYLDTSIDEVERVTDKNAIDLFGLPG